jgi:flagellar L-ring protein precursor FlgH
MKRLVWSSLAVLLLATTVSAQQYNNTVSLFTDMKAGRMGDILTVLIVEKTSASNAARTEITKDNKFNLDAGPGFGAWPIREIPLFGADGESKNESANEGTTTRSGSITSQMAVRVIGVQPNGDLVIEGSRVLGINNDKEMLVLTGTVRPQDISPQNTIYSYQIADAQITYRGKGIAANGGKPGWIMRFLNWLF